MPALEFRPKRFRAKHALGLDPGADTGSREENASKQRDRGHARWAWAVRCAIPPPEPTRIPEPFRFCEENVRRL